MGQEVHKFGLMYVHCGRTNSYGSLVWSLCSAIGLGPGLAGKRSELNVLQHKTNCKARKKRTNAILCVLFLSLLSCLPLYYLPLFYHFLIYKKRILRGRIIVLVIPKHCYSPGIALLYCVPLLTPVDGDIQQIVTSFIHNCLVIFKELPFLFPGLANSLCCGCYDRTCFKFVDLRDSGILEV